MMNSTSANNSRALIESVLEILRQGESLLAGLADGDYTRRVPAVFNASLGGHYRHSLDHFRSLLDAAEAGDLDYDHRERGTPVEVDRFAALHATRELRAGFERLDVTWLSRPLRVKCQTSYATTGPQGAGATVGREIMYAVAHAVHHYALIGVMGGLLGLTLPAGFGVAPSTLKHQADAAGVAA